MSRGNIGKCKTRGHKKAARRRLGECGEDGELAAHLDGAGKALIGSLSQTAQDVGQLGGRQLGTDYDGANRRRLIHEQLPIQQEAREKCHPLLNRKQAHKSFMTFVTHFGGPLTVPR